MKISRVAELLGAHIRSCADKASSEVCSACGSDMMSDVLAFVKDQAVLLTGLVNPQVVRTAEMMDMRCIVFVRSKLPTDEMLSLAEEAGIVLREETKVADAIFQVGDALYTHAEGIAGIDIAVNAACIKVVRIYHTAS